MGNKIHLKTNSIQYAFQSWTLVVWAFQICNIQVWKQDFLQRLSSFTLAQFFYENCQILLLSTCYALDHNSFSKNVDQIMRYKVGQFSSRLSPNCQIIPKKEFLLANLDVKFMYQLHPIMLPKISQISLQWVMRYKVTYIYGNLIQTTHLPHSDIFFWKKMRYFCLPIVSYHNT